MNSFILSYLNNFNWEGVVIRNFDGVSEGLLLEKRAYLIVLFLKDISQLKIGSTWAQIWFMSVAVDTSNLDILWSKQASRII